MRAVVTGANGHLGSTLCKSLIAQGAEVIACVRRPHDDARVRYLTRHKLTLVDFDLGDVRALADIFADSDVIFHTAAPTQLWTKNARDIHHPIYDGTLNVIRAASAAGVKKIIYTSSGAAVGFHAPKDSQLNEDNYNLTTQHPQFRAKVQSELEGARLAKQLGVELIRVCPPSVLGPDFSQPSPSIEPYVLLVAGKLRAIPDLSYPIIDVRDLASAQILLAFNEARCDRYVVAGEFVTTKQLLSLIAKADSQLQLPRLILPNWSLPGLAILDAVAHIASLGKAKRQLTLPLARECAGANQRLCDKRFRSEFPAWSTRPLLATIRDTLDWIRTSYGQ